MSNEEEKQPNEELPLHRFSCEAMATDFIVLIAGSDKSYAPRAAQASFDELLRLEAELSKFNPNSDISRINAATAGQSVVVGLETFQCLQRCLELYEQTAGAFDITVGPLMRCWLTEDKQIRTPSPDQLKQARVRTGTDLLRLNEDEHTVESLSEGIEIDLGGIGKGFAADKMREILADWELGIFFISGGRSSVYAAGAGADGDGWDLTISDPRDRSKLLATVYMRNRALGASGLEAGSHIIDAREGRPVRGRFGAWSNCPDATTADALSTAFMIMSVEEIEDFCERFPEVAAMVLTEEDGQEQLLKFGNRF